MQGYVYLIHLERPICPTRTSQHYLGWALDWRRRLAVHRAGQGAAMLRAAVERGIAFEVVEVWDGDRGLERYLKSRKEAARLCPICGRAHRRGPLCLRYEQLSLPLFDEPYRPLPDVALLIPRFRGRVQPVGGIDTLEHFGIPF